MDLFAKIYGICNIMSFKYIMSHMFRSGTLPCPTMLIKLTHIVLVFNFIHFGCKSLFLFTAEDIYY